MTAPQAEVWVERFDNVIQLTWITPEPPAVARQGGEPRPRGPRAYIARCWRRSQLRTDLMKHGSGISLGAATAAVALATLQATGVIR